MGLWGYGERKADVGYGVMGREKLMWVMGYGLWATGYVRANL